MMPEPEKPVIVSPPRPCRADDLLKSAAIKTEAAIKRLGKPPAREPGAFTKPQ